MAITAQEAKTLATQVRVNKAIEDQKATQQQQVERLAALRKGYEASIPKVMVQVLSQIELAAKAGDTKRIIELGQDLAGETLAPLVGQELVKLGYSVWVDSRYYQATPALLSQYEYGSEAYTSWSLIVSWGK
jgi:hypothetical protein